MPVPAMSERTFVCRQCNTVHSFLVWMQTNAPRHCHGCGSLEVVTSDDPTYDYQLANVAAAAKEFDDPPPRPAEPEPVKDEEEELRQERMQLAEHRRREIKAKPKPKAPPGPPPKPKKKK